MYAIPERLEKLRNLINVEKQAYYLAIKENKKFKDVKIIYLKIKQLERIVNIAMQEGLS